MSLRAIEATVPQGALLLRIEKGRKIPNGIQEKKVHFMPSKIISPQVTVLDWS